jgi:mRNA interferase MazF
MYKNFDHWNAEKKRLDNDESSARPFPREQWVWMCSVGLNIGFEQNGVGDEFQRPVLVVKKFNNQMYWVVPLSSKQKPIDFYYNFTDPSGQAVSLIASQLKLMSVKRFRREMYKLPDTNFDELIELLQGFLGKSKPRTGRGFSGP